MNETSQQIEATIAALEAQRSLLGDAVVESAVAPLRRELASRLAKEAPARGELRQVSVLFVDVVGSTAMGQQLDPEDIHAVMDGALDRFTGVVRANHGRVLQYTGDGMLAAFGTEAAHEDDVENAIQAGLAVIEEARRQAPDVLRTHGIPEFNVRAGINTGTVLLGAGVDAEGSIRGAVVNVAARMEQSAPAGGLRISHDTYRHVRGVFEVSEQPAITVKGIDSPVRSYLVHRARPRALRSVSRGIEGVETRIVGRERELARLRAAFESVVADRLLRAVTVVGDAGLGKSRLRTEFQQSLDSGPERCWLLRGRAGPRSALHPYDLLRDLLTRQFGIDDGDRPEDARAKLVTGLAPVLGSEGEAPAHFVGHLIGLDFAASPHLAPLLSDAPQIRDRAFAAVAGFLRGLSASNGAPVVVVLDDVHWADGGSLDLIDEVLRRNRDMPLMLLLLSRPTLAERRAGWLADEPLHERIDLKPLDAGQSAQLAASLLQRMDPVPPALEAIVTAGAEGNPFYMEELVKMFIDDGVIAVDGERWRVLPEKLLKAHVPPTLTGVLQARLDSLSSREKAVIQYAAVIGQVFSDEVLKAIDPTALNSLPALLQKQLVVHCEKRASDGVNEYAFQHNLLHQVAYDSVLRGPKRSDHAKVGEFWSRRAEVQTPQEVNSTSRRALVEAHYHRCQADPVEYAGWFDAQFFNYLNAYAAETLRPLAEALIGVCEQGFGMEHPQTAKALTNLSRVILAQGDVREAEPLLRRAIAIQERDPGADHPDTARTVAVLGGYYSGRGDLLSAEPLFRQALAIRERALGAEHPLTVGTLDYLASTTAELGRIDEAEVLTSRVLEIRERLLGPDHPDTWLALTALGDVFSKKQDFVAAEQLIRRALSGQLRNLPAKHPDAGLSMWNLAEALLGQRRYVEAEESARQSLAIWEEALGAEHEWTAWSLGSLAKLRLAQDDPRESAEFSARALSIHERTLGPVHRTVADTIHVRARALYALGAFAAAEPLLARALSIYGEGSAALAIRELLESTRRSLTACV